MRVHQIEVNFFTRIGPDIATTTTRRKTMMQEKRTMVEMMMAPTRQTTCSRRKPLNKTSATDQRNQIPEPLRQCAARGTLLGIKGHRMKGS